MASLATFAAVQTPGTIKGLGGCSISGTKLHVKPSRQGLRTKEWLVGCMSRSCVVVAKYGDKSVYFTWKTWEILLGNETCMDLMLPLHTIPCSKFFETFAAPFTKRGLLLKFLILGGGLTLAYFSSLVTGDMLPIKKGPQLPPKLGPRGKI